MRTWPSLPVTPSQARRARRCRSEVDGTSGPDRRSHQLEGALSQWRPLRRLGVELSR
jgi:hypothetical protein